MVAKALIRSTSNDKFASFKFPIPTAWELNNKLLLTRSSEVIVDLGIKHSEGSGERSCVSAHVHFCERVDFEGHHTVGRAKNKIFYFWGFSEKSFFVLLLEFLKLKFKTHVIPTVNFSAALRGLAFLSQVTAVSSVRLEMTQKSRQPPTSCSAMTGCLKLRTIS